MNHKCDLETSVPDWLIDHPALYQHFAAWGLEMSCGGKSLETACRERGLKPQEVLARIRSILGQTL